MFRFLADVCPALPLCLATLSGRSYASRGPPLLATREWEAIITLALASCATPTSPGCSSLTPPSRRSYPPCGPPLPATLHCPFSTGGPRLPAALVPQFASIGRKSPRTLANQSHIPGARNRLDFRPLPPGLPAPFSFGLCRSAQIPGADKPATPTPVKRSNVNGGPMFD